jgi:hypothetical protein
MYIIKNGIHHVVVILIIITGVTNAQMSGELIGQIHKFKLYSLTAVSTADTVHLLIYLSLNNAK